MNALILCGGKGTRLASVVSDVPKPLAPVNGRPFLDYVLSFLLHSRSVRTVILATGHLAEKVEDHYGSTFGPISIQYSRESSPLGTGGAILQAIRNFQLQTPFLVMNGDSFVSVDLSSLANTQRDTGRGVVLTVTSVKDAARFGTVTLRDRMVIGFVEKTGITRPGLINAGVYVVDPEALAPWMTSSGSISLEQAILPQLVRHRQVAAIETDSAFIDIGLPETYAAATLFFNEQ